MKIWKEPFGTTKDGVPASRFLLENRKGTRAVFTDFGVTLLALEYAGKDVILGYDSIRDYEDQTEYLGATVGRYAGPIRHGQVTIGDRSCQLSRNNEDHHIHGGFVGFSFRVWDSEILPDGVRFSLFSPDGEEGFPGNVRVQVTCRLTEEDGLCYCYDAVSDADTVFNMTCHAYFNLEGHAFGSALDHSLMCPARYFREEAPAGLPIPKLFEAEGTPFDFRRAHALGQDLRLSHPQLDGDYGYDRNAYLGESGVWKQAARIRAPVSGIAMDVRTTQSGMQLYCPGDLLQGHPGKGGISYEAYGAFCLETQHCLSPEEAEQGSLYKILPAGIPYHEETIYQFSKEL